MTKNKKSIVSLLLCLTLFVAGFSGGLKSSADAASDTQAEINRLQQQAKDLDKNIKDLKNQKASQQAILSAIEAKVANTQAQVRACNNQISAINAKIEANNKEIEKRNEEIAATKLEFQKRLRAIHMSNSDSSVKILLGAENFAEFLQLSQMTSTVSKHDKAIMEKIVSAIKELEAKNAENEKLIAEQVTTRSTIEAKLKELEADEAEAQKLYNDIYSSQKDAEQDKAEVQKQIKQKQDYLNSLLAPPSSGGGSFINPNTGFMWPVPGHYNVNSPYGERWGTTHYGIDISDGSIYSAPIVAITDGKVYRMETGCPHRDKKSRCRCGNGWGNHIGLEHGTVGSWEYRAMYAHMDTVAAGMRIGVYVKQGQVIGYVGTTGDSTGYHLHFGLMRRAAGTKNSYNWLNPKGYVY